MWAATIILLIHTLFFSSSQKLYILTSHGLTVHPPTLPLAGDHFEPPQPLILLLARYSSVFGCIVTPCRLGTSSRKSRAHCLLLSPNRRRLIRKELTSQHPSLQQASRHLRTITVRYLKAIVLFYTPPSSSLSFLVSCDCVVARFPCPFKKSCPA